MSYVISRSKRNKNEIFDKQIFIVYASHEERLAEALQEFFKHWRIDTFFCRQKDRPVAGNYRRVLAKELYDRKLVIPLLSRSFQWSQYCQAEAGAAATIEKPMIPVIIPPSSLDDIKEISPVLDGFQGIVVAQTESGWQANKMDELREHFGLAIAAQGRTAVAFMQSLQTHVLSVLDLELQEQDRPDAEEDRLRENIDKVLSEIIEGNLRSVPPRETLSVWRSLDRKKSRAPASVKENIKRSLTNADIPTSELTFVGVSLKFSLDLITEALTELAVEHMEGVGERAEEDRGGSQHGRKYTHRVVEPCRNGSAKRLQITLVHMSDQSHILHALQDDDDIRIIRARFQAGWAATEREWRTACGNMGVNLMKLERVCIDYIPPRIGILIDGSIFYAGRCSFPRRGDEKTGPFHLRAGENEYFFYQKEAQRWDDERIPRGNQEINEFKEYLEFYRKPNLHGVTAISGPQLWLGELDNCIKSYSAMKNSEENGGTKELTVISQTCTRFQDLVVRALQEGFVVKIYVQDPTSELPEGSKHKIKGLKDRIHDIFRQQRKWPQGSAVEVYYFKHEPTYRAVAIAKEVLGIQLYVKESPRLGEVFAKDLRLIVTKHFSGYSELRKMLIEDFSEFEGVSPQPIIAGIYPPLRDSA
jgi:TIR domain